MYWPTLRDPVRLEELGWVNSTYVATAGPHCDPSFVWGTTVETEAIEAFLVDQRRCTGLLISPAHILVRAVAESLQRHPVLNRRVIGRRVYCYDGINITMPMLQTCSGEVDIVFIRGVDRMSLAEIAHFLWDKARTVAVNAAEKERRRQGSSIGNVCRALARRVMLAWIHRMSPVAFFFTNRFRLPTTILQEINGSGAFVNYLGFPGAPPLTAYKPSYLPTNAFSVSVTMGPSEPRPTVIDNEVVIRRQASLFVRLDHRMVNGYQAAAFVRTLRGCLADPTSLEVSAQSDPKRAATVAESPRRTLTPQT